MAKYTITHSCGCEREYQLFGKNSERDRKIGWLESKPCPACAREKEEKETKEKIVGTLFEKIDGIELTGTEKQKKWAGNIRRKYLIMIHESAGKVAEMILPEMREKVMAIACEMFSAELAEITNAGWWIEHSENELPLNFYFFFEKNAAEIENRYKNV